MPQHSCYSRIEEIEIEIKDLDDFTREEEHIPQNPPIVPPKNPKNPNDDNDRNKSVQNIINRFLRR